MTLPQKFPPVGPTAITSYNYSDIADGLGYQNYYAAQDDTGYILTPTVIRSKTTEKQTDVTYIQNATVMMSGSAVFTFSASPFNYPRTVKGSATVQSFYMVKTDGVSGVNFVIGFDILKNSTVIGSYSGSVITTGSTDYKVTSGSILYTIPLTETHFGRGDIIKLRYNQWGNVNIGSSPAVGSSVFGTDPGNRTGTIIKTASYPDATTILKVSVPFRLDDVN